MTYEIHEVDGVQNAELLEGLNALAPEIFPLLEPRHYSDGYWWVASIDGGSPCAFAGLVPFDPFPALYFKRCFVMPDHYGHGLQFRMMVTRELKARQLGCRLLVGDCGPNNHFSASNFRKAGFEIINPEQKWAGPDDIYWRKVIA